MKRVIKISWSFCLVLPNLPSMESPGLILRGFGTDSFGLLGTLRTMRRFELPLELTGGGPWHGGWVQPTTLWWSGALARQVGGRTTISCLLCMNNIHYCVCPHRPQKTQLVSRVMVTATEPSGLHENILQAVYLSPGLKGEGPSTSFLQNVA